MLASVSLLTFALLSERHDWSAVPPVTRLVSLVVSQWQHRAAAQMAAPRGSTNGSTARIG